jgi:hypothetical protein
MLAVFFTLLGGGHGPKVSVDPCYWQVIAKAPVFEIGGKNRETESVAILVRPVAGKDAVSLKIERFVPEMSSERDGKNKSSPWTKESLVESDSTKHSSASAPKGAESRQRPSNPPVG